MHDTLFARWREAITTRYNHDFLAEYTANFLQGLLAEYINEGLADKHFLKEFESGNHFTYHQRLSELLFYLRLKEDGFEITSQNLGPDFKAKKTM